MAHLFSNYYEKRYKVSCCSCIAFCWCVFFLMAIIIPYIVCYSTGGMWKRQERYYEYPEVDFTGNLIVAAIDDQGQTTIFSTMKDFNSKQNHLSGGVPTIKIQKDVN